jgi:hypothetical protein
MRRSKPLRRRGSLASEAGDDESESLFNMREHGNTEAVTDDDGPGAFTFLTNKTSSRPPHFSAPDARARLFLLQKSRDRPKAAFPFALMTH